MKSTNYFDTYIAPAEDCPAGSSIPPPESDSPTVARMQFDMLCGHPFEYTSDDVLFTVFADRQDIPQGERATARDQFFAKGQPCFRSSPLTKRYSWGIYSDQEGKIALIETGSDTQLSMDENPDIKKVYAMRNKRKSG